MSEPTVTLRFPGRLHAQAKIEATRRGMSLQEFVAQAVEMSLGKETTHQPTILHPVVGRITALPERSRKLASSFVDLLGVAPEFYLRAIEKHVQGLLAVFRYVDKRQLEGPERD